METPSGKSVKSSNPSEYGFVYSAERPIPPPEAGWSDKQSDEHKISLYSENVLKEGDTTESVDRESIANLSTTKKQWESICTSHNINQEDSSVKKKSAPKWEVRIPYKEKQLVTLSEHDTESSEINGIEVSQGDEYDPAMFKKQVDSESAIEREIRLAHEREEIIRKEKEDRQKHTPKQKSQGQTIITSYEAESESFHPMYNELAEADRGSDLWGRGHRNRKESEDEEDAERNNENVNPNESIIEREIRLQKEREEEVARIRKPSSGKQQLQQEQHSHVKQEHRIQNEVKDVNHNQTKVVSYEEAIAKNTHDGESMIARELRELKEREEELKKLRVSQNSTHTADEVDGSIQSTPPSQRTKSATPNSQRLSQIESPSGHGLWQRDVSPFVSQQRRESEDSASSHGSVRTPSDSIPSRHDVRVRPIADGNSDDEDKKPNYFEKQETPIEREMRLAREREDELRRQKGLPELERKDDNSYVSYGASHESHNTSSIYKPRSVVGQPSESMRKFASSRLQQEVQKQNEREHELRSLGKLISTSEEHIEPKKYMAIAGLDMVDGTEKRNFVSKKISVSHNEADTSLGGQLEVTPSGGHMIRKTSAAASGGNMFSYKEFKQTAESKIERELREMREREEELRKQRTGCQAEDIP